MTLKKKRNRKIIRVSKDGNRKWVLLSAAICIIVIKISFILIYQGWLRDFRDS